VNSQDRPRARSRETHEVAPHSPFGVEYHKQALDSSREIGDRISEGKTLGNLGNAYGKLGHHEEAIEHYKQALVISRDIYRRRRISARGFATSTRPVC